MNILNRVTAQTLKKNRTRTLVTIIGIILSAAMITAVTTFIASLQNYMINRAISTDGNWHGTIFQLEGNKIDELSKNEKLESLVYTQDIGYSELEEGNNEYKPYLFISGFTDAVYDVLNVKLTEGRLPQNDGEIILPLHLKEDGGITYKLNETINLNIGSRYFDGVRLSQCESYYRMTDEQGNVTESEEFVSQSDKEYTVVGFYERPYFESYGAAGYTVITKIEEEPASDGLYQCFLNIKKPKEIYNFLETNFMGYSMDTNGSLLSYMGVSSNDNFYAVLNSLAAILIALIVFGSVSLIYNAFSISVSERTKQFGLLSSIGATKKQIRNSIVFEALTVSAIGIPIGIISGVAGIGVTLHFVGGMLFTDVYGKEFPMSVIISVPALIIAALIALITVLISGRIPSVRASKATPLDAIRQSADINIKQGKIKTSKFISSIFGLEGTLANKNFKRNKRKYRSTVVSLTMSIILFISVSSFTLYLTRGVNSVFENPSYDILAWNSESLTEEEDREKAYEIMKSVEYVDRSAAFTVIYSTFEIQKDFADTDTLTETEDGKYLLDGYIFILEDEEFRNLTTESKMDTEVYFSAETLTGIAYDTINRYDSETQRYTVKNALKKHVPTGINIMNLPSKTNNDGMPISGEVSSKVYNMKINDFASELPFGADATGSNFTIFIPQTQYDNILRAGEYKTNYIMAFKASDHQNAYNEMNNKMRASDYSVRISNRAGDVESSRNTITVMKVFSYGFIILISLISVANVFNTISTNIQLRRREFAMLKSVGMTKKGFNKMMNLECIMYGIKSIIYGLPLSFVMTFVIYKSLNEGVDVGFTIPWNSVLIAVISIFLVVFITMGYSMRKVKKENTIDALKNENY